MRFALKKVPTYNMITFLHVLLNLIDSSIESSISSLLNNYGTITEADEESEMEVSINGPNTAADAVASAVGGRGRRRRDVSISERFFNSLAKSGQRQTAGEVDLMQASIVVKSSYNKYVEGNLFCLKKKSILISFTVNLLS